MHSTAAPLPRTPLAGILLGLIGPFGLLAAAASVSAAPLAAARHGDFGHYTLALSWQPGFCTTDGGCLPDQPHDTLIGLHGLWASRPQGLIRRGISAPQWWSHGCDYYQRSRGAPPLPPATRAQLDAVMPHLADNLLTHEYDKHVQCFGFDAQAFFKTALRLRWNVADSAFGRYLTETARGHEVRRTDVLHAFMRAFHTDRSSSLQLRCGRNDRRRVVLTQLWITLRTDALASFPRAGLMDAPIPQHNCPAHFQVPDWR